MQNCHAILKDALRKNDPLLASEAARLIGEWKVKSLIPDLIDNALSSRFYSKTSAIYALVGLSAVEAIPCLKILLDAPNVPDDFYWTGHKGVRAAAAVALLHMNDPAGVPYLRQLAEAQSSVFHRWFAPALLRLDVPELQEYLSFDALCSTKKQTSLCEEYVEPGMTCMLCEALGVIRDPRADGQLEFYMNHYSRYVRGQAYRSLFMRDPDEMTAKKIFTHAAKKATDFDRLVAAEICGDATCLLDIAQNASFAFDRGSAIDSLEALDSEALQEACASGLEDTDVYVRQCAVEQFARAEKQEERNRLSEMMQSETAPRVRCAIAAALSGSEGKSC